MLYENYRARMTKVAEVLAAIKKFRILIISVCAVIVAVTATLLAISGIVYDVDKCPESVAVGDELGYSAGAVFNGVRYEFSVDGSENWTAERPQRPGEYLVRSVSKSVFGTDRYGFAHAFTVVPRNVEITVEQTEITYGDSPEVKAELCFGDELSCDSFIYEDCSRQQTIVKADTEAVAVFDKDGNDVTGSYIFSAAESEITFTPREITIVVDDRPEVYGGVTYTCGGYEIQGGDSALASGDYAAVMPVTFEGDAGEFDITPEVRIIKNNGGELVNVTVNYSVTIVSGKLTVEKRPVYVTTGSARKVYDGSGIASRAFELDENFPLAEGHSIEVTEAPLLVNAGKINNIVVFAVKDKDGKDVTANYSLLYKEYGELQVMPRPVTVRTSDESAVYDGNVHYSETFYVLELEDSSLFVEGDTPKVVSRTEKTLAGKYDNELGLSIFNAADEDVTGNYAIGYVWGTLEVVPRPVVIHTLDREWIYDGETHSYNGHVLTEDGYDLVEGHETRASGLASITEVGTVANSMIIGMYDGEGNIVTDNYNIQRIIPGALTVISREITVAAASAEKVYDGTALTANSLEVISETGLAEGHILHGEAEGSQTAKGSSANVIVDFDGVTVTSADGEDVTSNYTLIRADGLLTVTARNIYVKTAENHGLIYNGGEQYDINFTVDEESGLKVADGELAKVDEAAGYTKQTEVIYGEDGEAASFPNVFGVRIYRTTESGEDIPVTENYSIEYSYGTLKINPRPVTFVSGSETFIYNGADQSFTGHELWAQSPYEPVEGHISRAQSLTYVKNVKDSGAKNNLSITIYDGEGEDAANVTSNYAVTLVDEGILTVVPRPIYITTRDAEKVYDDTPLNSKAYYAEKGEDDFAIQAAEADSGLVYGHTVNTEDNREITEVIYDKAGEEVIGAENTLTVKIYDGEEQTAENEVSENYEFHYTYGELKVTRRHVKYKTFSDTFIYDGDEHGAGRELIEGELPYGHSDENASKVTKITDVGTKKNEIDVKIEKSDGQGGKTDVTKNYFIEYENGTLEVTARKITVAADDAEKIYDGTALTCDKVTVTYGGASEDENQEGLVKDHKATAKMTEESTAIDVTGEAGVKNEIVTGSVIIKSGETDVTGNYEVSEYVSGKLTVTPRKIKITLDDKTKIYDATPLTFDGEEDYKGYKTESNHDPKLDTALAEDQVMVLTVKGSQTEANEENPTPYEINSVKIYSDETKTKEVTDNYDVEKVSGKLTVTRRKIKITLDDKMKVYDATPLTFDGEEDYKGYKTESNHDPKLTPAVVEGQAIILTVKGSQTDANEGNPTPYEVNTVKIYSDETKTKEVTDNYDIEKVAGKLTVTRRPITVTTEDKDWIYDGAVHKYAEYVVADATNKDDGLVSDHTHAVDEEKDIAEICDVVYKDEKVSYKDNTFEIVVYEGDMSVTDNYKIKYEYGKLVINRRPITVITEDKSWVYDGETHSYAELDEGYVITSGEKIKGEQPLVPGHVTSAVNPTTVTDVTAEGGKDNKMTVSIADGEGTDKTANYDIAYVCEGKLSITARPITVIAAADSKVYNGKAQFGERFTTNSALGLVEGHTVKATTNESYTDAGNYKVTVKEQSARIYAEDGTDKSSNYDISYDETVQADFEIEKRPITAVADGDATVYNGKEQYGTKFTTNSELGLVADHVIKATTDGHTDAGEHAVHIIPDSAVIFDGETDVTKNYEITYDDQTTAVFFIAQRELYIITGSATKPYDGMPLTCNEYELAEADEETGLVAGHTVTNIVITGSQTEIGVSFNTVDLNSIVIEDEYGTPVSDNYNVIIKHGTLEVTSDNPDDNPPPIIRIESDKNINVFLRSASYGNYNGTTEWDPAEEYGATVTYNGLQYSANYLTSLALENAGYTAETLTVTYLVNLYGAYLPYYLTVTDNYRQTSDTEYSGDMRMNVPYTPTYYAYDYIENGAVTLPAEFVGFERAYSEFVYRNYLSVDEVTGRFLDEIIFTQGYDAYDINCSDSLHELISNIAQYIRGAAKYNIYYDRQSVDTDNVVISFLTVKEGVCRHYASAATMLLRRLGIPARYTTGINAYVNAGIPAEPAVGHAWVEAYINGLGWVMIDVTGAAEDNGGGDGNGTAPPNLIILKPQNSVKKYDGTPLEATALEDNDELSYFRSNGFTYEVTFVGSQTEVGTSESRVESFTLYDTQHQDITRRYNYKRESGTLKVIDGTVIYVHTLGVSNVYNGRKQTFGAGDYYCSSELDNFIMPQGYGLTVTGLENVGLTDVGVLSNEDFISNYVDSGIISIEVTKNGVRVDESEVSVEFDVHFEIVPIVLTFTTNSVTRVYNGKELSDCDISRAFSGETLVEGHTAVVTMYTKITDVGSTKNVIIIDIVDQEGISVLENYDIRDIFGTLTVLQD